MLLRNRGRFLIKAIMVLSCGAGLAMSAMAQGIVKSQNDPRQYAVEVLPNGLKLLVISDKNAQRSAVSLDVNVGSSADPNEFAGLAHFLEHMLFLGTDKYPQPDEFMQYISQHGGQNNAYTSFNNTNFFFDIDPQYLHQGMDRFARFFVAPLMTAKYVDRERNAVNAEYHSKLNDSTRRNLDVFRQVLNPANPYSRFTVGNLDTLPSATVRPALVDFYKKYYSADGMAVVILGKEPPATLLKWAKEAFGAVPKHSTSSTKITPPLFVQNKLPIMVKNQSLGADANLAILFALPYSQAYEYHKIYSFISYNLNYEGQNGLADTLKKKGLISALVAGIFDKAGEEIPFMVNLTLTDKGYAHQEQVLAMVFAYLDLMRKQGKSTTVYQELATMAKTNFKFQEKSPSMEAVMELSHRLNNYPAKDILRLNAIYQGLDPKMLTTILVKMTASQAVVQLSAPNLKFSEKTHFYQVPYGVEKLNLAKINRERQILQKELSAMALPTKNQFIASNYPLKSKSLPLAKKQNIDGIQLFYQQNNSFKVPRTVINIAIQPQIKLSVTEQTAMELWMRILNEKMLGTFYQASLAGINGKFSAGNNYFNLTLDGYQNQMANLLSAMENSLQNSEGEQAIFARVKEAFRQDLENIKTEMPFRQAIPYLKQVLITNYAVASEQLKALQSIDFIQMQAVRKKIMQNLAVRMLVYGNESYVQARELAQRVARTLHKSNLKNSWQEQKINQINAPVIKNLAVKHQDNAVVLYLQGGEGSQAMAEVKLLAQMIKSPFFNDLRTEKQMGYIVSAVDYGLKQRAGIAFIVESPKYKVNEITQQINAFNRNFATNLRKLTPEEFAKHKEVLITDLLQKPENLSSSAVKYWQDIMLYGEPKSNVQALVKELQNLKQDDFVASMEKLLISDHKVAITTNAPK